MTEYRIEVDGGPGRLPCDTMVDEYRVEIETLDAGRIGCWISLGGIWANSLEVIDDFGGFPEGGPSVPQITIERITRLALSFGY